MELNELLELIGDKELNYTKVEGYIANIYKEYEAENIIVPLRVMYSYLISYGFDLENQEDVFSELVNKSAFELSSIAKTLVSTEIVEYYEELLKVEHTTSLHPVVTSLDSMLKEFEELMGDYEASTAQLEFLVGGELNKEEEA